MRAMATVEQVLEITPIKDADRIELAKIRGWNVVVQKGLYRPGSKVVYCEIDSLLPVDNPLFESFMERGTKTDDAGRVGHVVKTIRLRGQYSQGVVIPWEEVWNAGYCRGKDGMVGTDVSDDLGIVVWEPPVPVSMGGEIRGKMPGWVQKTDAERIQNLEYYLPLPVDSMYATEKLDGTSATFTVYEDDFHVCSRNLSLKESDNVYWQIAKRYDIHARLIKALQTQNVQCATIQGEIFGNRINGNRLHVSDIHFRVFNVELNRTFMPIYDPIPEFAEIPTVPCVAIDAPSDVMSTLAAVDGLKSQINADRFAEGVVWKRKDGGDICPGVRAVKSISNKYLLKE